MDIILVPGLWLDEASWNDITPALEAAGHRPVPLTLPGLGAPADVSAEIGMAEWVAAVVEQIDATADPVVLVGHSGGGNVVWGAADARPDRVARVIFVDTVPPPPAQGSRSSRSSTVSSLSLAGTTSRMRTCSTSTPRHAHARCRRRALCPHGCPLTRFC